MLRLVALHILFQRIVKGLLVFLLLHINEVYANNSTHIAQTEETCNFFRTLEVSLKGVLFLIFRRGTLAISTVHVNNVHGFGVLYDKVCARFKIYLLSKAGLNLTINIECVE